MPAVNRSAVFLNVPYDTQYQKLYLALISGLCAFGLVPRAALEIPGGERRLDRIFGLMRTCRYSIHDLSRVQLDPRAPRTPRFNMPFELGLLLGWMKTAKRAHDFYVFEQQDDRLSKSLSDLDGTDIYIHDGTIDGVFRQLHNTLMEGDRRPAVQDMRKVYDNTRNALPALQRRTGARSIFEAGVFKDTVVLASDYAQFVVQP